MFRSRPSDFSRGGPKIRLDTPITYLKGVGPNRATFLHRMRIVVARDLLYHIPHRYEDATTITAIKQVKVGADATVIGKVISKGVLPTRRGLRIFQAVVQDSTGIIEVSWPGQPFLDRTVNKDDVLLLSGPVKFFHGRQLQPREHINFGPDGELPKGGRVLSVYPATEGISFKVVRSIIDLHLDSLLAITEEFFPDWILEEANVLTLPESLLKVHRPKDIPDALRGRDRLAFEELLFSQLLQRRANQIARQPRRGVRFDNQRRLTTALKNSLPYNLTGAQIRSIREIFGDMTSARKMHRLLQGDVGSGKTIVALFAAILALENGYQAAIMAPTELLAEQHYKNWVNLLKPLGIEPILLTGRLGAKDKRLALEKIATGDPLLVVGTHTLVQEGAKFGNLGFVAIDEQHRFGVEQRKTLSEKGNSPDVLLMSATPIPRSLALTTYGDLDVSVLDELPAGRVPITSVMRSERGRTKVISFIRTEIEKGRQAYVVYPVIEESEKLDLKAATTEYERLSKEEFPDKRVALLHGRIPVEERDETMRKFRDGEIDILVSTTVIEVGIDVPNATIMLIEHPERFGLSQLHQLRGRVGRGSHASYCFVLGDVGKDAGERLKVFTSTQDGFVIARADLAFRGMGDLFGHQQSGQASFKIADVLRDEALAEKAREIAERILEEDPDLSSTTYAATKKALQDRYARALELFRVG